MGCRPNNLPLVVLQWLRPIGDVAGVLRDVRTESGR